MNLGSTKAQAQTQPGYDAAGSGESWQQHTLLRVPGFDGSISLNLENF